MWHLVTYFICSRWNFLKEQMVIKVFAMLLLKVRLHLILFITVSLHYK